MQGGIKKMWMRRFPLKCPKVQAPNEEGFMSNVEIRADFQNLTQIMNAQAQVITTKAQAMTSQGAGPHVNPNACTPASRILDFKRINPPTFQWTKVDEDPLGFIDDMFNVLDTMGVNFKEKWN